MKRALAIFLAVCILAAAVSGCGSTGGKKTYNMNKLAEKLLASDAFSDILSPVDISVGAMVYEFDAADVTDYVLYLSTRATTEEIGIFKCRDEQAAKRVLAKAQERAVIQAEVYVSYAPLEPAKLNDGYIKADGVYVFYIIANNSEAVREVMK